MGLSCLLFCAPILVNTSYRWPFQALSAFMSDYVFPGIPSIWHVIDRWFATLNVLYQACRAFECMHPTFVLGLLSLALGVKYVGAVCAKRHDFHGYCVSHIAWHMSASAAALLVEVFHLRVMA